MKSVRKLGGGAYAQCRLIYVLEGDAKQRRVHGGAVGRANLHVSLERVENEMQALSAKVGARVCVCMCVSVCV